MRIHLLNGSQTIGIADVYATERIGNECFYICRTKDGSEYIAWNIECIDSSGIDHATQSFKREF